MQTSPKRALRRTSVSRPVNSTPANGGQSMSFWKTDNLDERVTELWNDRIVPFATNLASRRRAPRRRQAIPVPYDPRWPEAAGRLMARLRFALPGVESIEHIGSTSVPGMYAKDLVDLQMVVPDLAEAERVAAMGHLAGFVSAGLIQDIDRDGREVPEYCICDADPGQPVNVHIRPRDSIVWRDTLLLRDWLRAVPKGRAEYIALKQDLAAVPGGDVDQYSNDKMPWIAGALRRADVWRAHRAETGARE